MKCHSCGIDMVRQGVVGPRGGFYPFRKPTIYKCPKCKSIVEYARVEFTSNPFAFKRRKYEK